MLRINLRIVCLLVGLSAALCARTTAAASAPGDEQPIIGERLYGFSMGQHPADADADAEPIYPTWIEGARSTFEAIEAVLTNARDGAISIDPEGNPAQAMMRVLSAPASLDAASGQARLAIAIGGPRLTVPRRDTPDASDRRSA